MKFKVTGIDWDCLAEPSTCGLPIDTEIESDDIECVIDDLSDKYCWCINSVGGIYLWSDEKNDWIDVSDE